MTELLLVRHGETLWNSQGRLQGQQDSPLSALGLAQAQAIANRLRDEPFTAIYSSDLQRAYLTAQAIATVCGQPIIVDERLRERAYGVFEGLTEAEAEAKHPELFSGYRTPTPEFAVPGGESLAALRQRAVTVFQELVNRHPGERIVVVAHGGLLSAFLRFVLTLLPTEPRPFHMHNASLSQVRFDHAAQHWQALQIADITHLELI